MKTLLRTIAIAALVVAPVFASAQSNGPVTRAQVRHELIQLENVGYNPATANDTNYPANIQAAEARVEAQGAAVAQQNGAPNTSDTSGYGPSMNGSSQAGRPTTRPVSPAQPEPVYFGH